MKFLSDVAKAARQLGDPAFQRVLWTGLALTVGLLIAFGAAFVWGMNWLLPDTVALPWIGEIGWLDDIASGASVIGLLVLSVFLMVPVASAFTSFFLDDVTDAVEAKHYPQLSPAPRLSLADSIRDGAGFLGVLILANMAALVAYLLLPPFAPLIFYALNGFLLGREYFQLIAARRLGREGAAALRRRYSLRIWAAGCVMAVPLTVPIVNLLVPLLGAASFTHLYHRLPRPAGSSGRTSRNPAR
ncbi:Uncharacterized protein involved in cysteine biosynthesis [Palleronia marisminoris]|uniref:CysZ-like protein n=1 Tax=Palleronia marisminoris TaxID=315423 RepID=A0A1Y5T9I4_9RHOB|nr:EI24 domain-containing protein [Palleronia marisminoris]SFH16170.1 Uncharacterized protein involved in cysteine biosynthesis [Palleronia marisminoris]SLN55318.1 CysZ-like protein [Palleronia marisminoris]